MKYRPIIHGANLGRPSMGHIALRKNDYGSTQTGYVMNEGSLEGQELCTNLGPCRRFLQFSQHVDLGRRSWLASSSSQPVCCALGLGRWPCSRENAKIAIDNPAANDVNEPLPYGISLKTPIQTAD
jgi:hypothetical protein